jgi:hypothetical protein
MSSDAEQNVVPGVYQAAAVMARQPVEGLLDIANSDPVSG